MIEINNLTKSPVDKSLLMKIAEGVLEGENAKGNLSVVFVGPKKMRELNAKYRGKDKETDVLSFEGGNIFKEKNKEVEMGEVVICPTTVKENAKNFKVEYNKELAKILIHGILHILGYDHEKSEAKAEEMEEKQNCYLEKLTKN